MILAPATQNMSAGRSLYVNCPTCAKTGSYQVWKDSKLVVGASIDIANSSKLRNTSITIAPVSLADSGYYVCKVQRGDVDIWTHPPQHMRVIGKNYCVYIISSKDVYLNLRGKHD